MPRQTLLSNSTWAPLPAAPDVWTRDGFRASKWNSTDRPSRLSRFTTPGFGQKSPGNITVYSDSAFSTGPFVDSKPAASLLLYPLHRQNDVDPLQPIVWSSVDNATYSLLIGTGTDRGKNDRDVAWASQTTHTSWAGGVSRRRQVLRHSHHLHTHESKSMQCRDALSNHAADSIRGQAGAHTAQRRRLQCERHRRNRHGEEHGDAGNVPFPETFRINNWDNESGIAVCSDFANNLSVQLQNAGVVARRRDTIFGLGPLQHSIVGYRDPLRQVWGLADADFDIVFSNPAGNPVTMNLLEVAAALDQGNAAAIPIQFATTSSVTQGCPGVFWQIRARIFR